MAKTISPTTEAEPAATILMVPVEQLRESPFNPRKHYSEAGLRELSQSIAGQGILQPIVARPLPPAAQDIWVRYEIVFGHRRYRAALMVDDMTAVPVVVRDFTDEQAALAQVAENLQRQDVSQLEEADSFVRLHQVHGMSADQIAAGVNKSRSYVYGRLKLAKMAPEVRKAMADEDLPADIAIEVARIADHALQKKALKALKDCAYGEAWPSVRSSQSRLRGMYDNDVDHAPFDPADPGLAKLAGPCTTCPKRAGNDPDLQGVVAAGVCTDVPCFEGKTSEHFRIELVAMAAMGHKTLRNDDAAGFHDRIPAVAPKGYSYFREGRWIPGTSDRVDLADMMERLASAGQHVPKPLAVHKRGWQSLGQYLTDEQAEQVFEAYCALVGSGDDSKGTPSPSTAARARDEEPDDLADWTPAELACRDVDGWANVKTAVLGMVPLVPRTADDMRIILMREYDMADGFGLMGELMGLDAELEAAEKAWEVDDHDGDDFSYRNWWEQRLARMSPDALGALMTGLALEEALGYGHKYMDRATAARRVALAERYGVDVVAASQPEQTDDAGAAGGPPAKASAAKTQPEQLDAFGKVSA